MNEIKIVVEANVKKWLVIEIFETNIFIEDDGEKFRNCRYWCVYSYQKTDTYFFVQKIGFR